MWWWTYTDSFICGKILIMECIACIQNTGSDSMYSRNINVYYEGFRMCHWTVGLIKINTFNMITPICTVACNKFPCIRTVTFLNTRRNEWTEDFCSFWGGFYWDGIWNKANILFFSYWTKRASLQNCLIGPPKAPPIFFVVEAFLETNFKMWNYRSDLIKSRVNLFKICYLVVLTSA